MHSMKAIFGNLMLLVALITLFAVNATADQTTKEICGIFCVLLEDNRLMNDEGHGHYIDVEELLPDLVNGADEAIHAAVGQHLDAIDQNAVATELNAANMGLDRGIGHFMLFEVDSKARAPAPLIPKSPQTSSAASDRKSARLPSSRQVE